MNSRTEQLVAVGQLVRDEAASLAAQSGTIGDLANGLIGELLEKDNTIAQMATRIIELQRALEVQD